jgi:hypothetical protein
VIDQARLGQENHVADIALDAALQFRQRKVMRFQSPQANFRPYRERPDQATLVRIGHVPVI